MGANAANVPSNSAFFQKLVDEGTKLVLAGYGRAEELEADSDGVLLAGKTGYDPGGLRKFLGALNDRNNDSQAKQGLFASHPEMNERIQKLDAAAAAKQKSDASAVLADRFALHVKYQPVTLSQIPVVEDNDGKKDDKKKDDEKKPGKLSLSQLKNATGGGSETKQSASVTGSGGSRGVDRELTAKGGSNPAPVAVTITDTELAEFIRQGNLRG
jgi:predicted Zn-dependent protease